MNNFNNELIPEDNNSSQILDNGLNKFIIKRKIRTKRNFYNDLLENILHECKDEKEKLDMYYNYLQNWHTLIQSSVIIVSTASTFLQTFTQSLFINNNNIENNDIQEESNIVNNTILEEKQDSLGFIPILTLCVSTYSGLILSLAKFFKLDEKKENIHNLRERFAELHNKINHLIDLLKPWSKKEYFNDLTIDKINKWTNVVLVIEKEYINIIDTKKNLFIEFEKVIDSIVRQDYNRQHIRFKEKQSKLSSKMTELNRTKELHFKETSHEHDMKVQQVNAKYEINEDISDDEFNFNTKMEEFSMNFDNTKEDQILSQIIEPNINKSKNEKILSSLISPDNDIKIDIDTLEKLSQSSQTSQPSQENEKNINIIKKETNQDRDKDNNKDNNQDIILLEDKKNDDVNNDNVNNDNVNNNDKNTTILLDDKNNKK